MMKQLSIGMALVLAVACKNDAPSAAKAAPASAAPASPDPKRDVRPPPPALPSAAGDDQGGNRDEWRKRRDGRFDSNGDGVVSDEERAAAIHDRVVHLRTRFDADGDGKLTPAELANASGRMSFDDPAAIDTNHDGDISADELEAALKARREQRRSARGSAAPGTP